MKSHRNQADTSHNNDILNLICDCISAGLPMNCPTEQVIRRTIAFVSNLDAMVRDETMLKCFFNYVLLSEVHATEDSLKQTLSGRTLHRVLAELHQQRDLSVTTRRHDVRTDKSAGSKDQSTDEFLTQKELAKRWGVTTATLRRWKQDGKLRCHYMGRQVRYKHADVIEFEKHARV